MAAPTPSARGNPSGRFLGDGYRTLVAFAGHTTISFWEKSITPPGLDAGGGIDTTNMHNDVWRTMTNKHLITMTAFSLNAFYDPALYSSILSMVGVQTTVTVHFPDASSLCFFGFLNSFKPGNLEEGKPPEASIEVQPTNQDPVNCVEASPVFTAGPGTHPC